MTTTEKVMVAEEAREEGYKLKPILTVLELPKSTWYYHQDRKANCEEKYAHLHPMIERIIQNNPAYGYRRIKPQLEKKYGYRVNHKVLRQLLKEWDLSLLRNVRKPRQSGVKKAIKDSSGSVDLVNGRDDILLFEVAVTDFTEIAFASGTRRAKLIPITGYRSKMVYGWAVGKSGNTDLALKAWERAKRTFEDYNIQYKGMIIHHDQDTVFTGYRWLEQLLLEDQVRISYAMRGAKDNTVMESFNGHFKGESMSLFLEAESIEELNDVVEGQVRYYNEERLHSSLDYKSPVAYIKQVRLRKGKKSESRDEKVC